MKKIALACVAAIAASMISPISTWAADPFNITTGELYWDFEDNRQIAPPPFNSSGVEQYSGTSASDDSIESGGWVTMQPNVGMVSMPVFPVSINEVFAKNSGSGYDAPEFYYPTRLHEGTLVGQGQVKAFTDEEKAGKGAQVLGAASKNNEHMRTLGACIKLSDSQLIPGQRYKISIDAYQSCPNSGILYTLDAGVGVPSARETAQVSRKNWQEVLYSFDCYTGANSPKNAKWLGRFTTDETWQHFESAAVNGNYDTRYITAYDNDYENGYTILYVGIFNAEAYNKLANEVRGGTKLFLDNVKLTPVDANGNATITSIEKHNVSLGGVWDFEDDTQTGKYDAESGKPIDENNVWWPLRAQEVFRKITSETVTNMENTLNTVGFNGQIGMPAPSSTKLIQINKKNQDKVAGIKVYLEKDKFPAGTYKLKGTILRSKRVGETDTVRAVVFKGKESFDDLSTLTDSTQFFYQNYAKTVADTFASSSVLLPNRLGPWWSTLECEVELKDSDFVDGIATLGLLSSPSWNMTGAENAEYYNNNYIYYDDISLTRKFNSISSTLDGAHQIVIDSTVIGQNAQSFFEAAACYDADDDGNKVNMTDVSSKCVNNVLGFNRSNLSINSNDGYPGFSYFVWDKTTGAPKVNSSFYGVWVE